MSSGVLHGQQFSLNDFFSKSLGHRDAAGVQKALLWGVRLMGWGSQATAEDDLGALGCPQPSWMCADCPYQDAGRAW
mgnify:FL=1